MILVPATGLLHYTGILEKYSPPLRTLLYIPLATSSTPPSPSLTHILTHPSRFAASTFSSLHPSSFSLSIYTVLYPQPLAASKSPKCAASNAHSSVLTPSFSAAPLYT